MTDEQRIIETDDTPSPPGGWENWPLVGQLVNPDHMAKWVPLLWQLIFADDPADIGRLEKLAEVSQSAAVDLFIEQSCYDRDLPAFVGGKGLPAERRAALRAVYIRLPRARERIVGSACIAPDHQLYGSVASVRSFAASPLVSSPSNGSLNCTGSLSDILRIPGLSGRDLQSARTSRQRTSIAATR
jgi:hypothetical protein